MIGEGSGLQDIGAHGPTGIAKGFLRDLFLVNAHGCHNLPLVANGRSAFAWPSLACKLWMSDKVSLDLEPSRLAFQFPLGGGTSISATSKAPLPQMPTFLFPACLHFAHLSLHRLLSTRQ